MRRVLSAVAAACALALASCGTPSHQAIKHCSPSNQTMNCALAQLPAPAAAARAGTQLALSTTVRGIDFGWSCPNPTGYQFGASYLSDSSKDWTRSCLAKWPRHIFVWETTGTSALGGYHAGIADATRALAEAEQLGEPAGRPIYFAIDFDETPAQASTVAAYFRGIHAVLDNAGPVSFPHPIPVGGYGGYWTIKRLFDAHLISYGWQTYAWSGGLWDPRAQLQQYLNAAAVDYDRATAADYGQWPYTLPNPKPRPKPRPKACGKRCHQLRALASTRRALTQIHRGLKAHKCRKPYRRHVCVALARLAHQLNQRERWFAERTKR